MPDFVAKFYRPLPSFVFNPNTIVLVMTDKGNDIEFTSNRFEVLKSLRPGQRPTNRRPIYTAERGQPVPTVPPPKERRFGAKQQTEASLANKRHCAAALLCTTLQPCLIYHGPQAEERASAMRQQVVNTAMDGDYRLIHRYGNYFDFDTLQSKSQDDPRLQVPHFRQDENDPKSPLIPGLFRLAYQIRLHQLYEALVNAEDTATGQAKAYEIAQQLFQVGDPHAEKPSISIRLAADSPPPPLTAK